MGIFERAIKRGISEGIGKAVGQAISKAVEPAATELANKAAQHFDNAARNTESSAERTASGIEGAFANFERAAQSYATQMGKNIKICPECNQPSDKEKTFCPSCGTRLPEITLSEGAVCTSCSKQNPVGAKFCDVCGAKLPATIQAEEAEKTRDTEEMNRWDALLPCYPRWCCGGKNYCIEDMDGYILFSADFEGNSYSAEQSVVQYRNLLMQNGFIQTGQYPDIAHLYKRVDGTVYHVDTEHCFEGDPDCPNIYFSIDEPAGDYYYVKPEPKKPTSFRDLLGF